MHTHDLYEGCQAICINNYELQQHLTIGKVYTINGISPLNGVFIRNDNEKVEHYYARRFELYKECSNLVNLEDKNITYL